MSQSQTGLNSKAKQLHESRIGEFSLTGVLPPLVVFLFYELKILSLTEKHLLVLSLLVGSAVMCGILAAISFHALGKLKHFKQVNKETTLWDFDSFSDADSRTYMVGYVSGSFAMFFFACMSVSLLLKLL